MVSKVTDSLTNPQFTNADIAQFLADSRKLLAHSRTFYEIRDALAKAVAIIASSTSAVEPSAPIVCRKCGSTDTMPWPQSAQSQVTDVRALDLQAAREMVKDVLKEERQAERPPGWRDFVDGG